MTDDLEQKAKPERGSNLEIALTVGLGVLGALIGSAIVENTNISPSEYNNLIYVGGGITIGAAIGQLTTYVINRIKYSR